MHAECNLGPDNMKSAKEHVDLVDKYYIGSECDKKCLLTVCLVMSVLHVLWQKTRLRQRLRSIMAISISNLVVLPF